MLTFYGCVLLREFIAMVCLLLLCSAGAACMQASLRGHGAEKGVDYYVTRMNLYNLIFRMVILIPFLTQPPHERTLTDRGSRVYP